MQINKVLKNNNIPIVFVTDKNYYLYLAVAIFSLIKNKNKETKYDIIILEIGLDEDKKNTLKQLATNNVSINIVNIQNIVNKYKMNEFRTTAHIKESAYYRLLISEILNEYKKIIYLDCDLLIFTDLSKFYNINLNNKYAAVIQDYAIANTFWKNKEFMEYANNILHMDDITYYFNSGVMLLNLDLMRKNNIQPQLLEIAKLNKYFHDQDVLNSVFYKKVIYLEGNYNVNYHLLFDKYKKDFDSNLLKKYLTELKNPKILHFTSDKKPWLDPNLPNADIWWKYAKQTPFYNELLIHLKCNHTKNTN